MKNAAGHPVPPSAPTFTPKLSNFRARLPENCTHNNILFFGFTYKAGLVTTSK